MTTVLDAHGVARSFTTLMRREVKATPIKPADKDLIIAGHYVDQRDVLIGACYADRSLATFAGAAFSLIPADAARDLLKEKEMDENTRENFAEVLNVCSRMFKVGADERVKLTTTEFPPAALSPVSAAMLKALPRRVDYEIEVTGYGKGRFTMALSAD